MLSRLSVFNLAVVEKVEAEFSAGLTVLTGETGAGKSVLMGALELVLGGRADTDVIRKGAKDARVEASFSLEDGGVADRVAALLEEIGLPEMDGGELIVRRMVSADGKGRAWVNDTPVAVATLKRLGRLLVDIHGPRANQNLLEERFQRETLDAFGGIDLSGYGAAYAGLQSARARLEDLSGDIGEDELEVLRFQVDELAGAELSSDDEEISVRHAAAAHAAELAEDAQVVTEALGGDESASAILAGLQPRFHSMAKHFPLAADWAAEAEDLSLRMQELSRSVADAVSRLDGEEEDLEELDRRLTLVNRLKRKYLKESGGVETGDIGRLLEILEEKRGRLESLEHRDEQLAELQAAVAAAEKEVRLRGAELTKQRTRAATKLARAVTGELRDLGFLQASFSVRLSAAEPEASGCDRVDYMFGPNPGEPPRPLAAIASSGEIARVMLALKAVLSGGAAAKAHATEIPTLVFDEIDANIGGEVGLVVGAKMRAVAARHQVIAITHLPQSAAFGERHLVVSKVVSGGRTRTGISEVAGEARVTELARMLGGEKLTSVVRKHAEELLEVSR